MAWFSCDETSVRVGARTYGPARAERPARSRRRTRGGRRTSAGTRGCHSLRLHRELRGVDGEIVAPGRHQDRLSWVDGDLEERRVRSLPNRHRGPRPAVCLEHRLIDVLARLENAGPHHYRPIREKADDGDPPETVADRADSHACSLPAIIRAIAPL